VGPQLDDEQVWQVARRSRLDGGVLNTSEYI
jgi:hypothetical protein